VTALPTALACSAILVATVSLAPWRSAEPARRAIPVHLEKSPNGRWKLLRGGWPYFVRGACVWGENVRFPDLQNAGGNAVRTYHSRHARWTLDAAARRGMTVLVGYEINGENDGFSYLRPADVARQRTEYLAFVRRHRDHPALLAWAIGNEVEQGVSDPVQLEAMWKELNTLAKLVRAADPHHPTAIVLAGAREEKLDAVARWCPDVDLICFNEYADLAKTPDLLDRKGWDRPYLITEFGATGWWEAPKTRWGAPIEPTSTEKGRAYLQAYRDGVLADPRRCLGSYVFFWHPKQEATATWFGMFLAGGERLAMVDAMTRAWSRRDPADRCPEILSLDFDRAQDTYHPGETIRVRLSAADPEGRPLGISWRLSEEAPPFTPANAYETAPRVFREQVVTPTDEGAEFPAPPQPGAYRLFAYVYDGQGNAATGNLCFAVTPVPPAPLEIAPGTPAP
jgi:hypothetical protein